MARRPCSRSLKRLLHPDFRRTPPSGKGGCPRATLLPDSVCDVLSLSTAVAKVCIAACGHTCSEQRMSTSDDILAAWWSVQWLCSVFIRSRAVRCGAVPVRVGAACVPSAFQCVHSELATERVPVMKSPDVFLSLAFCTIQLASFRSPCQSGNNFSNSVGNRPTHLQKRCMICLKCILPHTTHCHRVPATYTKFVGSIRRTNRVGELGRARRRSRILSLISQAAAMTCTSTSFRRLKNRSSTVSSFPHPLS